MKKYIFSFLVFTFSNLALFSTLTAQEQPIDLKSRKNVIKTNLFSPISIGYERALGKHFSLSAYYLYLPAFSFGEPAGTTGYAALEGGSKGFTLEGRYYLSKTKPALAGFFVGAYYLNRVLDIKVQKILSEVTSNTTYDIVTRIPADLTAYGPMIGWQKVTKGGFAAGFTAGTGFYKFGNIPEVSASNSELAGINELSKKRSGVAVRLNLTLGYAF
jgi:hypothetical protein